MNNQTIDAKAAAAMNDRINAIFEAVKLPANEQIPALLKLLEDPDGVLGTDVIIGALTRIPDPRALAPVVAYKMGLGIPGYIPNGNTELTEDSERITVRLSDADYKNLSALKAVLPKGVDNAAAIRFALALSVWVMNCAFEAGKLDYMNTKG